MAHINLDLEDLGKNIEDIVNRAVSSHDYQKLNQTIRQTVEKAVGTSSETVRRVVETTSRSTVKIKNTPPAPVKDLTVLYSNPNGQTAGSILKIVGGGILTLSSLGIGAAVATLEWLFGIAVGAIGGWVGAACLLGGGTLIGSGIRGLQKIGRFKAYCKALGQKTVCALETLARSVGKTEKFVLKDVQTMIRQGFFREGHLDKEKTRLITSNETFREFEHNRLLLEQRQKAEAEAKQRRQASSLSPQVQEVLDKGEAFLAEIRRCNDAIPGIEISQKISRMEEIVEKIFDRVEKDPSIVPDLKKLMNYYLPMTVKLLNAYAEMDAQPVQGDTILASKREIEGTLDTLNLAYEKLLDELFADTALDVSSDISVLQTLLAQEGLTGDGLKTK